MSFFVCKAVALDDGGKEIPDKTYYYVTDENGNVVAGPCSKSDAIEIAKYLNELTEYAEIQRAIELFKDGKSLDDVKHAINGSSLKDTSS